MLCIKKLKFNKNELQKLAKDFDGYLWLAVDTNRGVISIGDECMVDLRDVLLLHRSHTEDIVTGGIDLNTGEIYIPYAINRLNPAIRRDGLSDQVRQDVENQVRYFFEDIPAYQAERDYPATSAANLVYN